MMLLLALFVPLAMNAQNVELVKKDRVITPETKVKSLNRAISSLNVQNGMLNNGPVQSSNLESRNFNTMSPSNATSGRGTRDAQYELVTSELTDWSGDYILGVNAGDNVYAFNGTVYDAQSVYGHNTAGYTSVAQSNGTISDAGSAAILTVAPVTASGYDGDYTIQINGGNYLGSNGDEGFVINSSANSEDYYWYFYWDSDDGVLLLITEGDDWDNVYGIVFYIETDDEGTYGGFCNYELSYDGSTFDYYYTGLYKDTSSSGGGSDDCDYEKVTASQTDWSGDYVITYVNGTTANVLTGKASGNNNYGATTTATITDNTLANADVAAYNVTIEPVTYNNQTKYTLKLGNSYLGYTSTSTNQNNYLYFATTIPTQNPQQYYWTISYSNNTVTLVNVYNTRRTLYYNTRNPRFACYTSAQGAITLFKKLTECGPTCDTYPIPYSYGFEDASDFNCWTTVDCESCSSNSSMYGLYNSSSYAHTGSKLFIFSSYCGETDPQYLISPELSGVVNGVHVEFYYNNCSFSNAPESFQVGYSTTDNNISSFTWVDSKSNTAQTYQHFTANYMGQVKYVAVKYTSADSYYLYLDDFLFEEAPSCLEPTNIVASNETTTSATISWTAGGSETEWDLYYTTDPSDVPSASTTPSISGITTNPQNLTGLTPASTYYVYLRSVCGGSETSAWSTPGIFNTECYTMTLPYIYGFEDGALSVCWTPIIASPVYMSIEVSNADPYNGTYHLNLDRRTPNDIQIIVLPEVDGAYALNNSEVSFYAKLSNGGNSNYTTTGRTLAVGVMTDPDDASTFVQVGDAVTPTASYAKYTFDLSSYSGDGQYIAIKHDESSSGNNGYTYIDDLEVIMATPVIPVESITVNPDEIYPTVGATYSIIYTVLPADATNPAVTFSTDDETVATVDENGTVTAVAAGIAKITIAATDGSGVTGTLTVNVENINVEEIIASDVIVMSGETVTINYQVLPEQATDKSVTFTSANPAIATVDENGVVTGVGVGETTITIASVQNPEVTTEITVTVMSNPNAVQFTVNAPATAYPGDVITVEAVLTAPEVGEYEGFNGLIMGINYDNTAFEYVANSMTYGPVVTQAQQLNAFLTPGTQDGVVQLSIISFTEGAFVTAEGVVFSAQFTVLNSAAGDITFTAEPYGGADSFDHEGTPVLYEATPSTVNVPAEATFTRTISGYGATNQVKTGWNLIASPISSFDFSTNTMISGGYDLYRFNQSADLEWENYKSDHDDFTTFETGRGYLYAHDTQIQLSFTGRPYVGDGVVSLTYDDNAPHATTKGWNLIGNPFGETAYLEGGEDFYIMNGDGSGLVASNDPAIGLMYGVFVQAEDEDEYVTFTTTAPNNKRSNSQVVLNVTNNNGIVIDRAIVRFNNGRQLGKLTLFEDNTKIYIPQDDADYAIVSSEGRGSMPINFKADEMGSYTIVVETEGYYTNYLHLIDRLTGDDVNLLVNNKYTFIASNSDIENRFILSFGDNANNNFAYQSGNDIVVTGEGELQVFDVMGRMVMNTRINGVETVNVPANAVYIFKLDEKVQKIVVR